MVAGTRRLDRESSRAIFFHKRGIIVFSLFCEFVV